MRNSTTSYASIIATVLLAAPTAFAQADAAAPPLASFDASLGVNLMTVEVLVVDERGQPVRDLEKEDFRLFEDGRPVELTHFEPPRAAAPDASDPGNVTSLAEGTRTESVEPPAHVVVFVDNLHIGVVNRAHLFETLAEVLETRLRPLDEVMVVSYDGDLRIELPFSDSRKELRAALEHQREGEARYIVASLEQRRAMERIQRTAFIESGTEKHMEIGLCVSLGQFAWEHARERQGEVLATIDSLRHIVGTLAGVPGRKTLIHLSDGVPLTPGAAVVQYAIDFCDGSGLREGIDNTTDITASSDLMARYWDPSSSRIDLHSLDTSKEWYMLAAQANAHRVTFYPIQTSGTTGYETSIAGQVRTTGQVETMAQRDPRDTLVLLAEETGGRAILDANDFGPALSAALDDRRNAYVIGFTPSEGGLGRRHGLRVEVTRAGVRARFPRAYYRKGPHERMADAVVSSLLHGVENDPLGIHVSLLEDRGESAGAAIRITVPLDKTTLLPVEGETQGLLTFFVAWRSADGTTSEMRQQTIPLRVAADAAAAGSPFVYDVAVNLPPGKHEVAVGVHDELGGEMAYVRREVSVGNTR